MAKLPTVALIGRPNAGKSTLFNVLSGSRLAIVSEIPGTTRDHVARRVEDDSIDYLLIDTGGIGGGSEDKDLEDDVASQSMLALENADVIVFTVSIRDELTRSDLAVAELLRKKRKRHVPVIVALTKCDNTKMEDAMPEYYALGVGDDYIPVSAVQKNGIGELSDAIQKHLEALHFAQSEKEEKTDIPRIALVGRPNVGKSSLINAFMSDTERQKSPRLVSDIPGTTRDPSDTVIRSEGKEYIFVDTAGMRRRTKIDSDIEGISAWKSLEAVANCDIVVLVLESAELISRQEKRIAANAIEEGKGLILLMNKNDLMTNAEQREREEVLRKELPFCLFAPALFCSAKTREGILKLFPLIETVYQNLRRRIPAAELRRWYEGCMQRMPARSLAKGKHLTQAKDIPPTFVVFAGSGSMIAGSQLRYLEKSLRSLFAFEGAPIRWVIK